MPLIPITQLTEGMVVKQEVKDRSGRLLIGKDVTLTHRHIHIARSWGVSGVHVHGQDKHPEENDSSSEQIPPRPIAPETLEEIKQEIKHRFQHNNIKHPAISTLAKEIFLRKLKERSSKKGNDA